jgi:hypothetical protein
MINTKDRKAILFRFIIKDNKKYFDIKIFSYYMVISRKKVFHYCETE